QRKFSTDESSCPNGRVRFIKWTAGVFKDCPYHLKAKAALVSRTAFVVSVYLNEDAYFTR
ncbi:MAG: hypothetical protein II240_06420, partial [Bacteroidaceae bacterium]|nr:hypothetical protein [Bacteroidaceae bacterium]